MILYVVSYSFSVDCTVGNYNPNLGELCRPCPANHYGTVTGASECEKCLNGTHTNYETGNTASSD